METLKFNIKLKSTIWSKVPEYKIYLNDTFISQGQCNQEETIEFTHEIQDGEQEIRIQLVNKDNADCVQDSDGNIVKDMLLHIDNILIDNIDLGYIKHTKSEFHPEDPNRDILKQCVDLGWNGTYVLKFTSPFYIWLLENM